MNKFLLLLILFCPLVSKAFPDAIRHGYVNCNSCHVSPSGGGVLNPYGRSLSKELFSTWGRANEEAPLHGLVGNTEAIDEWLNIGGDVRYIQLEKPKSSKAKNSFLMQAQLEFAVKYKNLTVNAVVGQVEDPRGEGRWKTYSPKHFILWNLTDAVTFKWGRYKLDYGLNLPDHDIYIKNSQNLFPWIQNDSLEMAFIDEFHNLTVGGSQNTSQTPASQQYTSYMVKYAYNLFGKYKIGGQMMNSEALNHRRRHLGIFAMAGFTEKLYLLSELDQYEMDASKKYISFNRMGYEVYKGVTPFLEHQLEASSSITAERQSYGVGLRWMPRPHFELQAKHQSEDPGGNVSEYILLHYYF